MLAPAWCCSLDVPLRFDETKEQQEKVKEREVKREARQETEDVVRCSCAGALAGEVEKEVTVTSTTTEPHRGVQPEQLILHPENSSCWMKRKLPVRCQDVALSSITKA